MALSGARQVGRTRSVRFYFLVTWIAVFSMACTTSVGRIRGNFDFNPTIRRDLQPLESPDLAQPLFSDGTAGSNRPVVSELYPDALVRVPPFAGALRSFTLAAGYWAVPGERLNLSWEVVLRGLQVPGQRCDIQDVGACSLPPGDPVNRRPLKCNGGDVTVPPWRRFGGTVRRQLCRDSGAPSEFNAITVRDRNCTGVSTFTGFLDWPNRFLIRRHGNFPFCQFHWEVAAEAGTYRLSVADGTNELASRNLVPSINVVVGAAVLARPMTLSESSTPALRVYAFSVARNGTWLETFNPSLNITRVRAFVRDQNAPDGKRFLNPGVLRGIVRTRAGQIQQQTCPPDSPLLEFNLRSCPPLSTVTPAYLKAESDVLVRWEMEFPERDDLPTRRTEVLIEFTIADPASGSGLALRPAPLDLGQVPFDRPSEHTGRLALHNLGGRDATINAITLAGPDASAFEVRLPGNTGTPFGLSGGTEIPLTIVVRPRSSSLSLTRATIHVDAVDIGGAGTTIRLQVPIVADGRGPVMVVSPGVEEVFRSEPALGRTRMVLIYNVGYAILRLDRIEIEGQNPGAFRIAAGPRLPVDIPSGAAEALRIEFTPVPPTGVSTDPLSQLRYANRAVLRVAGNAGEHRLALRGEVEIRVRPVTPTPRR